VEANGPVTELETTIQVVDPDTSQCGTNCFVGAWVMMLNRGADPNSIEDDIYNQAGWIENRWNPGHGLVRQVFTQNGYTFPAVYNFFPAYQLQDGMEYRFATEAAHGCCWNNYIYWQGVWNLLDSRPLPSIDFYGAAAMEHWLAPPEQGGVAHASFPPIQFSNSMIIPLGGQFQLWDTTVPSYYSENYPYWNDMQQRYYLWRALFGF